MRWRWLVFIVVIGAYLLSFFHRVAPTGIAQDLAASFHINAAALGLLAATYFYIYTIIQIPAGVLADTLGSRKILTMGGLIAGVGSLIFGSTAHYEWALFGRTLVGLGVSVVFVAMLKLIAEWFPPQRFASTVGIALLLGNIGSVFAGTPLSMLVQHVGWRIVFIVAGIMSLLFGLISMFVIQDRPQHIANAPKAQQTHWWIDLKQVLRNRATWPGFFVNFGIAGSFFSFAGLWAIPLLTQGHGIPRSISAHHLSFYFIAFAFGALFVGRLSDTIKRRKPLMMIGCSLYCCFLACTMLLDQFSTPWSYVFFFLMGFITPSFNLTWSSAKEVNPPALSGTAVSVVNCGMFLGTAILQPLGGWLMDLQGHSWMIKDVRWYPLKDYQICLTLHLAFALCGLIATLFIRETYCQNQWQEKSKLA